MPSMDNKTGPSPSDIPSVTSLTAGGVAPSEQIVLTAAARPRPLDSLTASAKRLTGKSFSGGSFKKTLAQAWQEDAWEMYDLVGEQRFLASTLANRMSQARFYVGTMTDDPNAEPDPSNDLQLQSILDAIGKTDSGRSQLIARLGVNLFVAGDAWLVGIPSRMTLEGRARIEEDEDGEYLDLTGLDDDGMSNLDEDTMEDLIWHSLSVSEVSFGADRKVTLKLGDQPGETLEVDPDEVMLIRTWRPHPRRSWEADSPTRASLPVLRELVGLTMHISAQIDSRLAGAGILFVPSSASRALKAMMGLPEDDESDPFTDALMQAMLTPISDRSNASAVVPLVMVVPDESIEKFAHMTFDKPLDTEARTLRDEAIRRLALGQDAPPELLLGTGGMNHWGAWLVREDVVNTHLEPPLALIADAWTVAYLRPTMISMGYSEEEANRTVIWYDVSHMIVRPNRATDAEKLHDKGIISDDSLREATGFDETDAPETEKLSIARQTAFEIVKMNPAMIKDLPQILETLELLLTNKPLPIPEPEPIPEGLDPDKEGDDEGDGDDSSEDGDGGVPSTSEDDAPALAASGGWGTRQRALLDRAAQQAQRVPVNDPAWAAIQASKAASAEGGWVAPGEASTTEGPVEMPRTPDDAKKLVFTHVPGGSA